MWATLYAGACGSIYFFLALLDSDLVLPVEILISHLCEHS